MSDRYKVGTLVVLSTGAECLVEKEHLESFDGFLVGGTTGMFWWSEVVRKAWLQAGDVLDNPDGKAMKVVCLLKSPSGREVEVLLRPVWVQLSELENTWDELLPIEEVRGWTLL